MTLSMTFSERLDGEPLKVAIVGSREYPDLISVDGLVAQLPEGTIVISGGALGVDQRAAEAARRRGLDVVEYFPKYYSFEANKRVYAPLQRNALIARECDVMVAFWDGKSKGTQHALGCTQKLGKPTHVITPEALVA